MPICQSEIANFRMNRIRGIVLAILLAVVLAQIGPFASAGLYVSAEETAMERTGYISVSTANVRSDPSTVNAAIVQITNGQPVNVIASTIGADVPTYGSEWYKISFTVSETPYTGYVVDNFVTLDPLPAPTPIPYTPDADFEAFLTTEGFPESYKIGLRELHAQYPQWIFRAKHTGLEWNTALSNEYSPGRSLISTSTDGYKSTDSAAYDWATNTWRVWDGSSWVMCHPEVLAYYMDPRNFLNEQRIFQFEALNYQPGVQIQAGVEKVLSGSFMANASLNYTDIATGTPLSMLYSAAFMEAAVYSNVNPYHLAARSRIEIGSNGSSSSRGTFSSDLVAAYAKTGITYTPVDLDLDLDGIYNFYNVAAYSGTEPLENVRHGLYYAKYGTGSPVTVQTTSDDQQLIAWSDPLRAIKGGAFWIGSKYINIGQDTLYLQKFDVDNSDGKLYYHQYMTNVQAVYSESKSMYNAYSGMGALSDAMTFFIPVFLNMPETACALPAKTANPNNWLANLAVDTFSLTPSFDPSVTGEYALIVENGVTSVNITAAAVAGTSAVTGTGPVQLAIGNNQVNIVVTAANGDQRTYTLSIIRKEPPEIPPLTSTVYTISGTTITGLNPQEGQNDVTILAANFTASSGYTFSILQPDGNPCAGLVGTGCIVRVLAGTQTVQDYQTLLFGDVNGDGKINAIDLTTINRSILQITAINGEYLSASDVNHDGKVNAIDLTILVRHILSMMNISQT